MGETLTEQRRVKDEGFRIVNFCCRRKMTIVGNDNRVMVFY